MKNSSRLFLIEDNSDIRTVLGLVMSNYGFDVIEFADGESALLAIDQFQPDAAVIDIRLPGADGYQLAREIRRLNRDRSPVLVSLTGSGNAESRQRALEAGFDLHFVKPAELKTMCQQISEKIESRSTVVPARPLGQAAAPDG